MKIGIPSGFFGSASGAASESASASRTGATGPRGEGGTEPVRPGAFRSLLLGLALGAPLRQAEAAAATRPVEGALVVPDPVVAPVDAEGDMASSAAGAATAGETSGLATGAPAPGTDEVAPELLRRLDRVIRRMEALGHSVQLVEGFRSQTRQDRLWQQGRSLPGPTVTWTRSSLHTEGRAVDVQVDGGWSDTEAYRTLQRIAEEEGLATLGMRDPGHLELPAGVPWEGTGETSRSLYRAAEGSRPEPVRRPTGPVRPDPVRNGGDGPGAAGARTIEDAPETGSPARPAGVARPVRVAEPAPVARPARPARPGEDMVSAELERGGTEEAERTLRAGERPVPDGQTVASGSLPTPAEGTPSAAAGAGTPAMEPPAPTPAEPGAAAGRGAAPTETLRPPSGMAAFVRAAETDPATRAELSRLMARATVTVDEDGAPKRPASATERTARTTTGARATADGATGAGTGSRAAPSTPATTTSAAMSAGPTPEGASSSRSSAAASDAARAAEAPRSSDAARPNEPVRTADASRTPEAPRGSAAARTSESSRTAERPAGAGPEVPTGPRAERGFAEMAGQATGPEALREGRPAEGGRTEASTAPERVARVQELQARARATGDRIHLSVNDLDGEGTNLRMRMKGGRLSTTVEFQDADRARQARTHVDELHRSLERAGLDSDTVVLRSSEGGATEDRGGRSRQDGHLAQQEQNRDGRSRRERDQNAERHGPHGRFADQLTEEDR